MKIADTIHKTSSANEIYFLLTSYLESLEYAGLPDRTLLAHAIALPLGGKDDVKARFHALIHDLDAASRQLDDHACTIIKEAVYVFGAALNRLHTLEQQAARELAAQPHEEPALSTMPASTIQHPANQSF